MVRVLPSEGRQRRFELSALEPRVLLTGLSTFDGLGEDLGYFDAIDPSAPLAWHVEPQASDGLEATFPLSSVPQLNSKSDAPARIILDFDGDGPRTWGTYSVPATPAYSIDGDLATFSQQELDNIEQIWARVAEKFSPFNINVTTVDTGTLQNRESVKVVIGGNGLWLGSLVGGVAYLNSFTNSLPNVVYVFPNNLGNGNPKYVAEASAHEAGHAFGLRHQSRYDGNGNLIAEYNPGTSQLAPIMGVSYNSDRGVWWLGTSTSATTFQNDLAILTNSNNAFGYRPDDHGGTPGAATVVDSPGGSISAGGVIEQMSDVDMFAFHAGAGPFNIQANVAQHGPMLDLQLELLDSDGVVVMSASTSSLGESLSGTLDPGIYYLAVKSAGEYGDIGQYTISGTVVQAKVLQFSQPVYEMRENVGVAVITVTRSDAGSDVLSVDYATSDGTALDGVDYQSRSGVLVFSGGQTSQTIEIPILDNDVIDGDKSFSITLSNPTNEGMLGVNSAITVRILDTTALVRFSASRYVIRESAGEVTISVTRNGSLLDQMSVDVATVDGTATAWDHYIPVNNTLEFAVGQRTATFTIQIAQENLLVETGTVLMTLSNPQGGVVLTSPVEAELTIFDETPPAISSVEMVPMWRGMGIGAVKVTFSEPMHALRTADWRSYSILAPYNRDGRLAMGRMHTVPIISVTLDEATNSVTLVPRKPLPPNRFYLLSVNGNIGPADRADNLLDGNRDGQAGGIYRTLFGRGNRLGYVDHDGTRVHLALFRGGVMELFRDFNGTGQTLSLHGTQEGWSVLRGTVAGFGRTTTLQDLIGDDGVVNELSSSIFIASRA